MHKFFNNLSLNRYYSEYNSFINLNFNMHVV